MRSKNLSNLLILVLLVISIKEQYCFKQHDSSKKSHLKGKTYTAPLEFQDNPDVDCYNTKELLEEHPSEVLRCGKKVLYQEPRLRADSDVVNYDLGDVIVRSYEKVQSIRWPYYPENHKMEEGDMEPFNWFHTVQVIVPQNENVSNTALFYIYIHENNPQDDQDEHANEKGKHYEGDKEDLHKKIPRWENLAFYVEVAKKMNAVIILGWNIPNQNIVLPNGNSVQEDGIVAWTWRMFIENAEKYTYLPLQIPMSVSASAVMTWSINQIYKDFGVKIDSFIPTGYSKRGYQTWLTALYDERVPAFTPIVGDLQNTRQQFVTIGGTYGTWWPYVFGDYNIWGVTNNFNFSPEHHDNFDLLVKITDPMDYRFIPKYRKRLSVPKLIVESSGDDFFVPQGSQTFYKYIPNGHQNFQFRVENVPHVLPEKRIMPGIIAFFKKTTRQNKTYPRFSYQVSWDTTNTLFTFNVTYTCQEGLTCDKDKFKTKLWIAQQDLARDFRHNCLNDYVKKFPEQAHEYGRYSATDLELEQIDDKHFNVQVTIDYPPYGWKSAFIQIEDQWEFTVSTSDYVLEGHTTMPYNRMPQGEGLHFCTLLPQNFEFY